MIGDDSKAAPLCAPPQSDTGDPASQLTLCCRFGLVSGVLCGFLASFTAWRIVSTVITSCALCCCTKPFQKLLNCWCVHLGMILRPVPLGAYSLITACSSAAADKHSLSMLLAFCASSAAYTLWALTTASSFFRPLSRAAASFLPAGNSDVSVRCQPVSVWLDVLHKVYLRTT